MVDEHYFSARPESDLRLRSLSVELAGTVHELVTAGGIFSPERIDTGTAVLLANTPPRLPVGICSTSGAGGDPSRCLSRSTPRTPPCGPST